MLEVLAYSSVTTSEIVENNIASRMWKYWLQLQQTIVQHLTNMLFRISELCVFGSNVRDVLTSKTFRLHLKFECVSESSCSHGHVFRWHYTRFLLWICLWNSLNLYFFGNFLGLYFCHFGIDRAKLYKQNSTGKYNVRRLGLLRCVKIVGQHFPTTQVQSWSSEGGQWGQGSTWILEFDIFLLLF